MSEIKRQLEKRVEVISDKLDLPWDEVMDVVNEIIFDPFFITNIVGEEIVEKAKKYDKIMTYLAEMEDKNANIQTGSVAEKPVLDSEK